MWNFVIKRSLWDVVAPWLRRWLSFIHSFITEIYIAPLQGYYSEALPTLARLKRSVLRLEASFNWRVGGSTPALAATQGPWVSPLPAVACALRHETPIQYPCCSRERLWVVEDLEGRYWNGRNEWMNEKEVDEKDSNDWLLLWEGLTQGCWIYVTGSIRLRQSPWTDWPLLYAALYLWVRQTMLNRCKAMSIF